MVSSKGWFRVTMVFTISTIIALIQSAVVVGVVLAVAALFSFLEMLYNKSNENSISTNQSKSKSSNQRKPGQSRAQRKQWKSRNAATSGPKMATGYGKRRSMERQKTLAEAREPYESEVSHPARRKKEVHSDSKHRVFPPNLPLLSCRSVRTPRIKISEPTIVYKATENWITELVLLPGTKLVCPGVAGPGRPRELGKMRVDRAVVSGFYMVDEKKPNSLKEANHAHSDRSYYNPNFVYRKGEQAQPDAFDDDLSQNCTAGLHVWATPEEAIDWFHSH